MLFLFFVGLMLGCLDATEEPCEEQSWFLDEDGDGYGGDLREVESCEQPHRYASGAGDCDDADAMVHPGGLEKCDEIDNNCDGLVDEDVQPTWYVDDDGDGFGHPSVTILACDQPSGYVQNDADCDDGDPLTHPGADEVACDGTDSDCDGIGDLLELSLASEEFSDLQTAIDSSGDGKEILVCPGVHPTQSIVPADRKLTIRSWSGDAADTILDGELTGRTLTLEGRNLVTVRDLSLTRGVGQSWGGLDSAGAVATSYFVTDSRSQSVDTSPFQVTSP